ncbi:MAG: hypothetical protein KC731_19315 [Myxococcales bacterium]|nr:hypothetical protein [Myxococcales bacterium]
MQQAGQLAVRVGGATAGVSIVVAGASPVAVGTATLIAATGGAAAVVLVGYGVYKLLSPKEDKA